MISLGTITIYARGQQMDKEKTDELIWTNEVSSRINANNSYEYYALFAAINCIYPGIEEKRVKEIVTDFDNEFQKRVDEDITLKYRPSDALYMAFDILGKVPELSFNTQFAKKAFSFLHIENQLDEQRSEALYDARDLNDLAKIEEMGGKECGDVYRFTRKSPEIARETYLGVFQNRFNLDPNDSGIVMIRKKPTVERSPIDDYIEDHVDKNGNLTFSQSDLEKFKASLVEKITSKISNKIEAYIKQKEAEAQDAAERLKMREQDRIENEALYAGMNIISKLFFFIGNDRVGSELALVAKFGAETNKAINDFYYNSQFSEIGSALILASNFVNIAFGIVSFFNQLGQPNGFAILAKQINEIKEGLNKLFEYNKIRFDRIDKELNTIFELLVDAFDQLNRKIDLNLIDTKDIKAGLFDLQNHIFLREKATDVKEIQDVYTRLSEIKNNSNRVTYGDKEISVDRFIDLQSQYNSMLSIAANELFSPLIPIDNNLLELSEIDRNLNQLQIYLANVLARDSIKRRIFSPLPLSNPLLLAAATDGLLNLLNDWPERQGNVDYKILDKAERESKKILEFVNELRGDSMNNLPIIVAALIKNYNAAASNLIDFINEKEREYVNIYARKTSKIFSAHLNQFKPYYGVNQPLPDLSLRDIQYTYCDVTDPRVCDAILKARYLSTGCDPGEKMPDSLLNLSVKQIPSFLKIMHILGYGELKGLYLDHIIFTDPKPGSAVQGADFYAKPVFKLAITCQTGLFYSDTLRSFSWYLGKYYSNRRYYFGKLRGLPMCEGNWESPYISKIFSQVNGTSDRFYFEVDSSGTGIRTLFLDYSINKNLMIAVLKPSSITSPITDVEELNRKIYEANMEPKIRQIQDSLRVLSRKLYSYITSTDVTSSPTFQRWYWEMEKSRNALLDVLYLTVPVTMMFSDSLQSKVFNETQFLNFRGLRDQYKKYVDTIQVVRLGDYFHQLLEHNTSQVSRVILRWEAETKSNEFLYLDIGKLLDRIRNIKIVYGKQPNG